MAQSSKRGRIFVAVHGPIATGGPPARGSRQEHGVLNSLAAIKLVQRIRMNCSLPTQREFLRQLLAAIDGNRLIACRRQGEDRECHIAVYGLVFQGDHCYVVGVHPGEAKLRLWNGLQLQSIRILDECFAMPALFSLEKSDIDKLLEEC